MSAFTSEDEIRALCLAAVNVMAEQNRFFERLRAEKRIGNVICFPEHRRIRSVREVRILESGADEIIAKAARVSA